MPRLRIIITVSLALLMVAIMASSAGGPDGLVCTPPRLAAAEPGQFRAPTGQLVSPAGRLLALPSLPLGMAVSPDGQWLVTSNNGAGASLSLVKTSTLEEEDRVTLAKAFIGVVFSPDGRHVYAAAGGSSSVATFRLAPGTPTKLTAQRSIPVRGYPAGLAINPAGTELYVAQNLTSTVAILNLAQRQAVAQVSVGPNPYALAVSPDGSRLYASHWLSDTVSVVDLSKRRMVARVQVGSHPTGIAVSPDGSRLFVANAYGDNLAIVDTQALALIETVSLSSWPGARHGASPNSVAVSPDGRRVFVTLPGSNAVAVVGPQSDAAGRPPVAARGYTVLGLIPSGWYPSAVAALPGGQDLAILAAKGLGQGPTEQPAPTFPGALQTVAVPDGAQLAGLTRQVRSNNLLVEDGSGLHPWVVCPAVPWLRSKVRHVVYILKENRTYDQVLGDWPGGDGEPSLVLFGKKVTPNTHALAEQFATADRFFADGEVSAQGHLWAEGADTSEYIERTWPQYYLGRGRPEDRKTSKVVPPGGLLFDSAQAAGISYRIYGEMYGEKGGRSWPSFRAHRAPDYPGFDLDISDQQRADAFLTELAAFEASGQLPDLLFVWLPNDHTAGVEKGKKTPRALVADNDLALGRIIEALSRSQFWPDTVVFVVEDDAQNGPDHIDSHRTVFLAAGPAVKRSYVSHVRYDQAALLRTIEVILGLAPMSQYDALAAPMLDLFADQPDLAQYRALPAQVPLDEVNAYTAPGQATAADLTSEDDMDDDAFSAVLWEAITGTPYSHALDIMAAARLEAGQSADW